MLEPFRPAPRSQKESASSTEEQGNSFFGSVNAGIEESEAEEQELPLSTPVVAVSRVRKKGCLFFVPVLAFLIAGAAGVYYYVDSHREGAQETLPLLPSFSSAGEEDPASFPQLLKAAQAGNKAAYIQVAEAYDKGIGTSANAQLARSWYVAAEKVGSVAASLALAELDYAEGAYASAVPRYTCAAAELTDEQLYRLASCHYHLLDDACSEAAASHAVLAAHYYTAAASQQHAQAALQLGHCYYKGIGVAVSLADAITWFRVAAEQGVVEAQFRLAWCLMQQTPADNEQAVEWLARAAKQGHSAAAYNLALCLLSGRGVEKNASLALTYLQQAAEQNYTSAIRRLAFCYRDGEGSPRNLPLAVSCFARAAEAQDAESAYNYAWCLHHGFGVEPDLSVAVAWYVYAAQLQYPPAQEILASFRIFRMLPEFCWEKVIKSQNYPKM